MEGNKLTLYVETPCVPSQCLAQLLQYQCASTGREHRKLCCQGEEWNITKQVDLKFCIEDTRQEQG